MRTFTFKHGSTELSAAMNINCMRAYARERGLKYVEDVIPDINVVDENNKVSFEMLERRGLLLLCAIREGERKKGQQCTLSVDDVFEMMEENREEVMRALASMFEDIEVEEAEGNPKALGKSRKK